jgi:hypothetical protein
MPGSRVVWRYVLAAAASGMALPAIPSLLLETIFPWLRLGNPDAPGNQALTIRDLYAPALDLSSLPFAVDVVIGYSVLRHLTLRIDVQAHTLTLAHPDLGFPPVSDSGAIIPVSFFEHFPAIGDLVIDGVTLPTAVIDTGSNTAITVGPDLAMPSGVAPGWD